MLRYCRYRRGRGYQSGDFCTRKAPYPPRDPPFKKVVMTTFGVILRKKGEHLSRGIGNKNARGCHDNFFFRGGLAEEHVVNSEKAPLRTVKQLRYLPHLALISFMQNSSFMQTLSFPVSCTSHLTDRIRLAEHNVATHYRDR